MRRQGGGRLLVLVAAGLVATYSEYLLLLAFALGGLALLGPRRELIGRLDRLAPRPAEEFQDLDRLARQLERGDPPVPVDPDTGTPEQLAVGSGGGGLAE